jgi:ribosomal protein S6--L-glutamate ligase
MILHILIFARPKNVSGPISSSPVDNSSTSVNIELLREATEKLGHELRVIYDYDCQMKFIGSTGLCIRGYNLKDIKVILVKANLNGAKMQFRHTLIKQFELAGVNVINKEESVMNAKNKLCTLQLMSAHNIPIPKTYVINHSENLEEALVDIGGFPVILKAPSGSQGSGVSIIESKRSLRSVLQMTEQTDPVIIQEYIKESTGKDIRVFIVGNKIIGAMERVATKRDEFRSNFQLGGKVLVTKLSDYEKKISLSAVKACGLDMAGVDILRAKSGPKIIEVNANPGLEGITQATGKDIAGEIIKYMMKRVGK